MLEDLMARALELGRAVRRAGNSNRTLAQSYLRLTQTLVRSRAIWGVKLRSITPEAEDSSQR
jgi:hypothetical protein